LPGLVWFATQRWWDRDQRESGEAISHASVTQPDLVAELVGSVSTEPLDEINSKTV
jgi:hypothetical protein